MSQLVKALSGMPDTAPEAIFRRDGVIGDSLHLVRLTSQTGWLMIGRHQFQTLGVVTEHYVVSATCDSIPSLHPEAGLALAGCPFEPTGEATEVSEAVEKALRQGLQRQTPRFARERHERNVTQMKDRIGLLTGRLAELDREVAATREALRAFVRRTGAYLALQEELNRLLQEDRKVFVERRKLRGGEHVGIASLDDLHESTQPVGIIRWRLEP
jgi:hypothetical protein